jgi:hypothetical protein
MVPLDGGAVAQCRVDYAFTLVVDGARGSFDGPDRAALSSCAASLAGRRR